MHGRDKSRIERQQKLQFNRNKLTTKKYNNSTRENKFQELIKSNITNMQGKNSNEE